METDGVESYCKKRIKKEIRREGYSYLKVLKEERSEKEREILIEKTISRYRVNKGTEKEREGKRKENKRKLEEEKNVRKRRKRERRRVKRREKRWWENEKRRKKKEKKESQKQYWDNKKPQV
jgi:hypothetical protein